MYTTQRSRTRALDLDPRSIAIMQNTAAAAETRKRRRYRCECGQNLDGLSDYHVLEHRRSARHRKALDAAKTP